MPITKEQEAIEKLEYYLKNSAYKRENSDFFKNGGWEIVDLEIPKAIETVLSMLQEQQEKMDKKDKQIDLMAFNLADYVMYYEYDKCRNPEMIKNKAEELKQYFADLVKKE